MARDWRLVSSTIAAALWVAAAPAAASPAPVMVGLPLHSAPNHDNWSVAATLDGAPTAMMLSVDLGSSSTGVVSDACRGGCDGLWPRFVAPAAALSSAARVSCRYGDGTYGFDALVVHAQVALSDLPAVPLWLGAIVDNSLFAPTGIPRGILGLGPDALLSPGTDSYLRQLAMQAGEIPVISLQLCNPNGRMWIGGYDAALLREPLAYTPLHEDLYWRVAPKSVRLGAIDMPAGPQGLAPFILDNGIDEARLPQEVYDGVVAMLASNTAFRRMFPAAFAQEHNRCLAPPPGVTRQALDATLPTLSLWLPQEPGEPLFELRMSATESYLSPFVGDDGDIIAYCNRLAPTDGPGTFSSPYMRGLLVVLDVARHRLGIARHRGCEAPQEH